MSRFVVSADIVWRRSDDDLVLFDRRDASYHTLNATGSAIWRQLADGSTVRAVVDTLARQFAADTEAIAVDIASFVDAAVSKGFLRPAR